LDAKESEKVKNYLETHPEMKAQILQLMDVREMLGKVEDKEVIAPPIFMDDSPHKQSIWFNGYLKTAMSIAASLLLLLVAAKLLDTEITYSQSELKISFGVKAEQPVQQIQTLSSEQVQQMINSSLVKNNEVIAAEFTDNQKKLNQAIRNNLDLSSKKIDGLMKSASLASQDQVRAFVASLQNENVKTMREYMQLSSTEQNKYMESLLVDFTKYLNEQRNQDIQLFQTRMSTMEKNTVQFKEETEQILASIINSGATRKQSSYE